MTELGDAHRKMPAQRLGRSKQDYGTPRVFLDAVEARWGKLMFDLAATDSNAVVRPTREDILRALDAGGKDPRRHYTPEDNSLKQPWGPKAVGMRPWLNPPFGNIGPWAKRCRAKAAEFRPRHPDYRIFLLLPASVGSNWWADHVHPAVSTAGPWDGARCCFLQGRLSFDGKNPYPKDCALIVYGDPPGHEVWNWRKK